MTLCPFLEVLPLFLLLWYKALRGSFSAYINEAADIFGITEKTTEYGVAFALKYLSSEMLTYFFGYGGFWEMDLYALSSICNLYHFSLCCPNWKKTKNIPSLFIRRAFCGGLLFVFSFNLYKIFKIHKFLFDFLFAYHYKFC